MSAWIVLDERRRCGRAPHRFRPASKAARSDHRGGRCRRRHRLCRHRECFTFVLPYNSGPAVFLLDHGVGSLFSSVYPLTIQNVLHVLTACGLGILFRRWQRGRFERQFLAADLLPTDDYTLLSFDELGRLRRRILPHVASRAFLPVLVDTAILQATNTRSLEQASCCDRQQAGPAEPPPRP